MTTTRNFTLGLLLLLSAGTRASAQEGPEAHPPATPPSAIAVTVSVSPGGIRFAALGGVKQMRLEVFGADDEPVYVSEFIAGNVRDWALEDRRGQPLSDGVYVCVVTFRDISGKPGVRQGTVLVQGGKPSLQMEAATGGLVEPERSLSTVASEPTDATILTTHDGSDGQLVTTRGGLSFRSGDFFAGRDRELMRLTPDGSLGLGVASPQAKLDVAGVIRARGGIQFEDGTVLRSAKADGAAASSVVASAGAVTPSAVSGTGTVNRLTKWVDASGSLADSVVTEQGGQVGVGTTNPASLLHLAGASGAAALTLNTPGSHRLRLQTVPGVQNWGALTLNVNYNAGWQLDDTSTNGWFFKLDTRGGNAAGPNNGLWLYRVPSGANPHTDETPAFGVSNGLAFFAGSLGIGTQSPKAKLDVAGDIKVSGDAVVDGNIAAKYQDLAEWVESSGGMMPAGTVVALDVTRRNTVAPSSRAYDTHVAGVVSERPGVILGQRGEGKVLIATTGRVKMRVDATHRPVRIGDLLVTSGKPGVAMRSVPVMAGRIRMHRPGTIVGKALEPLSGGEGEILVLLSLQ